MTPIRRKGDIRKQGNLSFESPDSGISQAESVEPEIFWNPLTGSPIVGTRIPPSPLALQSENNNMSTTQGEPSQSTPTEGFSPQEPSFNTPTSHRTRSSRRTNSVFKNNRMHPEKDSEKENLLRKIQETAMLHLQKNVETYIKSRNEELARKRKSQGTESEGESLLSPRTALEREVARFTPSKRRKFFPEARVYSSQISISGGNDLTVKRLDSTPKRPPSPMTSTPRFGKSRITLEDPNISPVSTPRRSKRLQSRISSTNNDNNLLLLERNDSFASPNATKEKTEDLHERGNSKEVMVQQPLPSEIYIIPDDSWDDSF